MKKKKAYISLPMGGYEKTVWKRYVETIEWFNKTHNKDKKYNITGPVNIDEFFEGNVPERDHDWNWYIGEDVKELLTCDTIIMTRGWAYSKGCLVEAAVAKQRDMTFVFTPDSDLKLLKDDEEREYCGYDLDKIEVDRIEDFKQKHLHSEDKTRYSVIFKEVPGLGSSCHVRCDVCQEEIDVTNYDSF